MGDYTQVRGWLNINSAGDEEDLDKANKVLKQAQKDFQEDDSIEVDRKEVCEDTFLHKGHNGCIYLFFGTEIKNYGNPSKKWIEYLLKYFPNAEGRIDFQDESETPWEDINLDPANSFESMYGYGSESVYMLIYKGRIVKEDYCRTWCRGYGNQLKIKDEEQMSYE